jgi:hypothetical protein
MSKVQFDFSTVRTRVVPILRRVEVEDYPLKIGRVYGLCVIIAIRFQAGF